jgi:hypothetical protein
LAKDLHCNSITILGYTQFEFKFQLSDHLKADSWKMRSSMPVDIPLNLLPPYVTDLSVVALLSTSFSAE